MTAEVNPVSLRAFDRESDIHHQSLIIQLGVKECLLVESSETKRSRSAKSTAQVDDAKKSKPKDEHDLMKLLAMIERCGVVVTEVPAC
jgi:hypothetical protein